MSKHTSQKGKKHGSHKPRNVTVTVTQCTAEQFFDMIEDAERHGAIFEFGDICDCSEEEDD